MSGPWNNYAATAPAAGPWSNYTAPPNSKGSAQLAPSHSFVENVKDATKSFGKGVVAGGAGLDDFVAHLLPIPGAAQYMDKKVAGIAASEAQDRDQEGRTGTDWANLAGQVASPVNYVPVGDLGAGISLAEKLGKLAVQGAVGGAASPTDPNHGNYLAGKFKQIAEGAAGSAAGGALLHGAAAAVKRAVTPDADYLMKQGVRMTPGQLSGGAIRRAEDVLTSIGGVGNVIRTGQERAIKDFNKVAINRALAPIGQALPKGIEAGNDAIAYARKALSDNYERLNGQMIGKLDKPFLSDVAGLSRLATNLPMKEKAQFARILQDEVLSRFTPQQSAPAGNALAKAGQTSPAAQLLGGVTTGHTVKEIESTLGALAKTMMRSDDYDVQKLGGGIKELQASVVRMRDRVNPQFAGEVQKANAGYANFKRVQRAASSVGAKDGVFTPAHLLNAAKAGDFTKDKRAFSEGDALMQDLATAGKNTLPQQVRDSGTPERGLGTVGLVGAGAAAVTHPLGTLAAGVGAALAALPYTSPGMSLLSKFAGPATRNYLAGLVTKPTPYLTGSLGVTRTQPPNAPANN